MCDFCEEIEDFDTAEKILKSEARDGACLCKSPTGDIWFCMRINDDIKACVFDFCPMCGRNLAEPYDPSIEEIYAIKATIDDELLEQGMKLLREAKLNVTQEPIVIDGVDLSYLED